MPSWKPDRIPSEDEVDEMADFEETKSRARKAAMGNTPTAPPPKKTRTAAPAAVEQGGAGLKVVSSSLAESHRHGTFGVVATCMCDHPSTGKFLKLCIASFFTLWLGYAPARTRQHALTRRAGTQASDR